MNIREYTLSSLNKIIVIDDLFPIHLCHHFELFAQESKYTLGSTANNIIQDRDKTFFQCFFRGDDLKNFRFHEGGYLDQLSNYISPNIEDVERSWITCSSPFTKVNYHCDAHILNKKTLLYYINRNWGENWGGETLFCNSSGECEFAVNYKPYRIVIFDSEIRHRSSALTTGADEFRFTFVMQMKQTT